jgi:hypothetical protein
MRRAGGGDVGVEAIGEGDVRGGGRGEGGAIGVVHE